MINIHPIQVGKLSIPNNIWLAPLAGYTNYPFRKVCRQLGAGLSFTEMVSCKGLWYDSENTKKLLFSGEEEKIKAVQIFGSEPQIMRSACESEALAPFSIVDINMGCPMPKIYNNGEGSALLNNLSLAEKIISECVKSGKMITVKFRTGIDSNHLVTSEFAKMCEGAGASAISIHGRTRDKIYAGEVDYAEIEKAKKGVKIPVLANGGVFSLQEGEILLSRTGADGIMLARGALYNPTLFCDFFQKQRPSLKEVFLQELADTEELFDQHFTVVFMRKMAALWMRGKKGGAAMKEQFFRCKTTQQIREVLSRIDNF